MRLRASAILLCDVNSFEGGTTRRSAKGSPAKNTKIFAGTPSVHRRQSRRLNAAARPATSQASVTLSRHGHGARRVAFLRPRGVFSDFCSPLDYVSARTKHFQEDEKLVPHDRRTVPYSEWGRKARMGLPAKCTFCGVPGRRGFNIPPRDVKPIHPELPTPRVKTSPMSRDEQQERYEQ